MTIIYLLLMIVRSFSSIQVQKDVEKVNHKVDIISIGLHPSINLLAQCYSKKKYGTGDSE